MAQPSATGICCDLQMSNRCSVMSKILTISYYFLQSQTYFTDILHQSIFQISFLFYILLASYRILNADAYGNNIIIFKSYLPQIW